MQKQFSEHNQTAWNQHAYEAWLNRFGTPEEAAALIGRNPEGTVRSFSRFLGDLSGIKAVNLLGSHGSKAAALALLGASEVTVVDIAAENAKYGTELAEAAGVRVRYVVSDVLELPEEELTGDYGLALMEFGILHYFLELKPLFDVVVKLLASGGRLILQDFHPVTTKLISSRGSTAKVRKHKVTGDYFDTSIEETDVAYSKFLPGQDESALIKVRHRKWTIGEIVTAAASSGLFIEILEEEPNRSSDVYDKGIPKSFTLVAKKL
ncbi:class I SAM-dependent methyltransferase [Paenibacillus chitinolyticus]|uniref:class I SAM-dependent methyltransferase n=1 Tax=Paenibacillus chitinolyticus TaxID=79263 RepID=UPI002DB7F4BD|nr:class I SAM-dependent methyltransferase [Paenibacillus chitinolyticus]MEC0244619.1 class I SAM-dependent methyltransferase [Paenibacillus chitinolyticus]